MSPNNLTAWADDAGGFNVHTDQQHQAQTLAADNIIPEVYADLVAKEFPHKIVFAPLAAVDTRLQGQPGETIEYPVWELLQDAVELAETDRIVPQKLTTSKDAPLTIKEAGTGIEVTDKAKLTGLGDPESEGRRQLTQTVANKIDKDLYATLTGAGSDLYPVTQPFSIETAPEAFIPFGSLNGEPADEFAGWVMDVTSYTRLLTHEAFLTRDKAGNDATLFRGAVGSLFGVPVLVSSRVTDRRPLLVRKGALILAYKRTPIVETDRDILGRSTVVTTNVHYGTLRAPRRGVARFAAPA